MRRLGLLAVLTVLLTSACGGKVVAPVAQTVVGTVPGQTTETVPPEYANGDPAAGKPIFKSKGCTACHTLKDAGATGNVGPNLDEAKPAFELVVTRVSLGKGVMPAFSKSKGGQLEDQQIADVAQYVSTVAGH